MALDWPNTPTTGSVYTPAGSNVSWMWDGTKWTNVSGLVAPSGRNFLHNPYFNIQQRGTGPWTVNGTYGPDRWSQSQVNDALSVSIVALADSDRAAIGDEAAVYAMQCVFTGSATASSYSEIVQHIEGVRRLSNKQVTLSFWARAIVGTPKIGIGWVQGFGSGGSPSAQVTGNLGVTPNLSTTWQRYSFTGVLPSSSGKIFGTTAGTDLIELALWLSDQGTYASRSGGIGVQSGTVQFWGLQLELGTAATPLEKLDPETDLAHCQRFYYATRGVAGSAVSAIANVYHGFLNPVTMRAQPTGTLVSNACTNLTNVVILPSGLSLVYMQATTAATGMWIFDLNYSCSADL